MFDVLKPPPTEAEIVQKYQAAMKKRRATSHRQSIAGNILMAAPPVVDLCLLPVLLPLMAVEVAVSLPFEIVGSWLNDNNPEIYAFISRKDSDAYDPQGYGPCQTYVDAVRAQGRLLTAGEIASMQRYKWVVNRSGDAVSGVSAVVSDVAKKKAAEGLESVVSGLSGFFRK